MSVLLGVTSLAGWATHSEVLTRAGATTVIAGVGLLGVCFYAYDAGPTPLAPQGGNVSVPVVIAAVLMAVALATWRHDIAPASLFVRQSLGGTLSRGILSTLVVVPIV